MLRNGLRALWILLIALDAAAQPEPADDEKPAKQEKKPWERSPGDEKAEKPAKGDKKAEKPAKGDKKAAKPAKGDDAKGDDAKGDDAKGDDAKGDDEAAAPKGGGSMDSDDPALTERSDKNTARAKPVAAKAGGKGAIAIRVKDADADVPPPNKRLKLFGELLIGFGKAPVVSTELDATTFDSTVLAFMVGGSYDVSEKVSLLLRVPWSTATSDTASGQSQSANAFGSPELLVEYRVRLSPRTYLPIQFGVGIPIAQGDPDITSNDSPGKQQAGVNLLADAAGAWQDGELYAPKRFPMVASIGIRSLRKRLGLHAYTKFVFLPNVGEGTPANPEQAQPAGAYEINGMALRAVTGGGIGYEFLERPRLGAGLESWTVWNAIEPMEFKSAGGAKGPTKFQFALEPRIFATFGAITPSVGYVVPVGGRLADSGIQGLRLRLDAQF